MHVKTLFLSGILATSMAGTTIAQTEFNTVPDTNTVIDTTQNVQDTNTIFENQGHGEPLIVEIEHMGETPYIFEQILQAIENVPDHNVQIDKTTPQRHHNRLEQNNNDNRWNRSVRSKPMPKPHWGNKPQHNQPNIAKTPTWEDNIWPKPKPNFFTPFDTLKPYALPETLLILGHNGEHWRIDMQAYDDCKFIAKQVLAQMPQATGAACLHTNTHP